MDFATLMTMFGNYELIAFAFLGFIAIVFPWLGKRGDASTINSLFGKVQKAIEDIATVDTVVDGIDTIADTLSAKLIGVGKLYPQDGAAVTITADSGVAWQMGTLTQVVAASTIASDFSIYAISICGISDVDEYELRLTYGAGDTEACRIHVVKSAAQDAALPYLVTTPKIPANSVIKCAISDLSGHNDHTIKVKIQYNTY